MVQEKLYGLANKGKAKNFGARFALLTEIFIKAWAVISKNRIQERSRNCTILSSYFQPSAIWSGNEKKNKFWFPAYLLISEDYKLIPLKNAGYGAGRWRFL